MYQGLPEVCYGTLESTGETIILKRGESGYWKSARQESPDLLNSLLGVTNAQAEAMKVGSLFGWDVKGADPSVYDEDGKFKKEAL